MYIIILFLPEMYSLFIPYFYSYIIQSRRFYILSVTETKIKKIRKIYRSKYYKEPEIQIKESKEIY